MMCTKPEWRTLILGANDIGSAATHRLFTAGYFVVLHESPLPATTRRRMAFTDTIFDGFAWSGSLGNRLRGGQIDHAEVSGILERPARIAQGVLRAVKVWEDAHVQ